MLLTISDESMYMSRGHEDHSTPNSWLFQIEWLLPLGQQHMATVHLVCTINRDLCFTNHDPISLYMLVTAIGFALSHIIQMYWNKPQWLCQELLIIIDHSNITTYYHSRIPRLDKWHFLEFLDWINDINLKQQLPRLASISPGPAGTLPSRQLWLTSKISQNQFRSIQTK